MCERPGDAEDAVDEEDAALWKIFYECDVSSVGQVPVHMLIGYIKKHISDQDSSGLLKELQRSLCAASVDGSVTWLQFRDASRRWVEKVRQLHEYQDGNNNHQDRHDDALVEGLETNRSPSTVPSDTETPGEEDPEGHRCHDSITNGSEGKSAVGFLDLSNMSSYSTSSVPSTRRENEIGDNIDLDRDYSNTDSLVGTVDLRARVSKITKDNTDLRDELHQAEESISSLQQQLDVLRRKLEQTGDRCKQLERENDEQKESLDAAERKEGDCQYALQKFEKQCALLVKQLEEAETEKQRIPALVAKLETTTRKEKELARQLLKYKQELSLKNAECEDLQDRISKNEDAFKSVQECYESTVHHLKNKTHDLETQLLELQLRDSAGFQLERNSLSPPVHGLNKYEHSTPCSVPKIQPYDSLCAELEASGFPFDRSRNDLRLRELEDEVEEYRTELDLYKEGINGIIEYLEKATKALADNNVPEILNLSSCNQEKLKKAQDSKMADLEHLQHQAVTLILLVAEKGHKGETRNVGLQVSGLSGSTELPEYLNIMSYHDLVKFLRDKNEHGDIVNDLKADSSKPPQMPSNNRHDATSSPTVAISPYLEAVIPSNERITPGPSSQKSSYFINLQEHVILPIDKILQGSTSEDSSPSEKQLAPRHNPRYSYTLPSSRLTQDTDLSTPDTPGTPSSEATHSLGSPNSRCKLQPSLISSGGDALIVDTSNQLPSNHSDCQTKFSFEHSKQHGITSTAKFKTGLVFDVTDSGKGNVEISLHECDSASDKVQENSREQLPVSDNPVSKSDRIPLMSNEPCTGSDRLVCESTESISKRSYTESYRSVLKSELDFGETKTEETASKLIRGGLNKSGARANGRGSQLCRPEDATNGLNDNRLNLHSERILNSKRHSTRVNLFGRGTTPEDASVEGRSLDVETLLLALESLSLRSSSSSTVEDASMSVVAANKSDSFPKDKDSPAVKKSTRIQKQISSQEADGIYENDSKSSKNPEIIVSDRATSESCLKVVPQRKISVFHCSFDYSSLKPEEETSRELVKRSVSFPSVPNEETKDSKGQDFVKESSNFSAPRFHRSFDSSSGENTSSSASFSPCRRLRSSDESYGEEACKESSNSNFDQCEGKMQQTEAFGFVPSKFRLNSQAKPVKYLCQKSRSTDESTAVVSIVQRNLERDSAEDSKFVSDKNVFDGERIDSEDQKSRSACELSENSEEYRSRVESHKITDSKHNFRSRNANSLDISMCGLAETSMTKISSPVSDLITAGMVVKLEASDPLVPFSTSRPEVDKDYPSGRMLDTRRPDGHPRPPPGESNRGRENDLGTAPVVRAMSSGEDSSDSEFSPVLVETDQHVGQSNFLPDDDASAESKKTEDAGETVDESDDLVERKHESVRLRRSVSGSDGNDSECRCKGNVPDAADSEKEDQPNVFPSFPDERLSELGLTSAADGEEFGERVPEDELEQKYTAISVGLGTDRLTLPRRLARSLRHRDQAERNLATEILKGHQDIQALAPLCIDRESVERVERVRHQLEMISKCAHRVSCAAEMLGAAHQEHRISRAAFLADRYLLILRARCEKLATDLAETKRILTENHIVVEESSSELGDEIPKVRYRSVPPTNRTMLSRRRASIATISRPLISPQEIMKDAVRQRNSVSGRMTLRRPSLCFETQKWDSDKLDRTDSSSSSIGELREIFEQAESRRSSREENNNLIRSQSSNFSIGSCESMDSDIWGTPREVVFETEIANERPSSRFSRRTSEVFRIVRANVPKVPLLWCILISFFFGFYVKHVVSTIDSTAGTPLRWWSLEELLERHVQVAHRSPLPT